MKDNNSIFVSEWADINKNVNNILAYLIDIKESDL